MAPVREAVASWATSESFYPEAALFSLLLLFLLSVIFLAVCIDCGRHSFELREGASERPPSALIRVVRLEDVLAARENPMIDDIKKDEREFISIPEAVVHVSAPAPVPAWEPEPVPEVRVISVQDVTPWRSHMVAPERRGSTTELHRPTRSPAISERRSPSPARHTGELNSPPSAVPSSSSPTRSDSVLLSPPPPAFADPPAQGYVLRGGGPEPLPGEGGLGGVGGDDQDLEEDPAQHIYDVVGEERNVVDAPQGEFVLDRPYTDPDPVTPGCESGADSTPARHLDPTLAMPTESPALAPTTPTPAESPALDPAPTTPAESPALDPAPTTPTYEDFCVLGTSLVEEVEEGLSDRGWNPLYAQVSRRQRMCPTPPPVPPPEDEGEEEEESSPPLPDRSP